MRPHETGSVLRGGKQHADYEQCSSNLAPKDSFGKMLNLYSI